MKKIICFLIAVGLTSTAFSGGYAIPEQGAKSAGMAGAFTGIANDPSAIYFNPAGISFISGMNMMLGSTFVSPSAQYQNPAYSNTIYKQKDLFFVIPQFYFTYQWEYGLSFGAGVYAPYGLGTEWQKGWVGDALARKTDLQNIHFSGVVAYRVMDNFSVAGSFAYSIASAVLNKAATADGLGGDVGLEGSGSGIHWSLSALYKPMDKMTIGVVYRGGTTLTLTGDIKFSGDRVVANTDAMEGKGEVKLPIPANFNVGVSYAVLNDLTVSFDYDWAQWSDYKDLTIVNTDKNITLSSAPRNWENTTTIRFGAEYRGFDKLALRGGFLMDSNPVSTKYMEPSLPDAGRTGYTFGLGYQVSENINLDAYLLLVSWDEKHVTDNAFNFNGYYNTKATLSGVSVSYKF